MCVTQSARQSVLHVRGAAQGKVVINAGIRLRKADWHRMAFNTPRPFGLASRG